MKKNSFRWVTVLLMFLITSVKTALAVDANPADLSEQFKCEKCHTVQGWKISNFNHEKTGFSLRGAHKAADCRACHKSGKFKEPVERLCNECHRDVHAGKLGKFC